MGGGSGARCVGLANPQHEIHRGRALRSNLGSRGQHVVLGVFAFMGPAVAALLLQTELGAWAADPGFLMVVGIGYWVGLATFIVLGGEV